MTNAQRAPRGQAAARFRWLRGALLLPILAAPLTAVRAQQTDAPKAVATQAAVAGATVTYGGAEWRIDPGKGPVQGVVTRRSVDASGVTIEGIVFVHDGGGWRAAGTFIDPDPNAAIRDANVDAELTLGVAGS